MNTTPSTSSLTHLEFWFIPIDLLTNICISLALILVIIFFLRIIFDKNCHTVPMLPVANSCLIGIIFGMVIFSMNLFKLVNDIKQQEYRDLFCSFRGYMGYATCSILNCSYLLQAIYRFIRIVYPNQLIYQTAKFQLILICLTWIFGIIYPIAFLFTNEIVYNVDNQICQLRLYLSFSIIYMANFAYITPVSLTMIIYLKLVSYVKKMTERVTPVNTLYRAKRELKMVRRTVILVSILIIYCFPYAMFIFLSFFIQIPKYHFRISYIFIDASYLFVIIALFQFTAPLKISIMKLIQKRQNNEILPTVL
jgi:hypothetical protein